MGDLIDERAALVQHQDGIAQGRRFGTELDALEVAEPRDLLPRRAAGHDQGERRVLIGARRDERAQLDAAAAVGRLGALEIRHSRAADPGLAERVARQRIATDQLATAVREQRVGTEHRAVVEVEPGLEPLDLERALEALRDRARHRDDEAGAIRALVLRIERDVLVEADGEGVRRPRCRAAGKHESDTGRQHCPQAISHIFPLTRT
jgi:hypothetical protein